MISLNQLEVVQAVKDEGRGDNGMKVGTLQ